MEGRTGGEEEEDLEGRAGEEEEEEDRWISIEFASNVAAVLQ